MKCNYWITLIALTLFTTIAEAQNSPDFFKVFPVLDETEPDWVIEMYSDDANVFEVIDGYHAYYRSNPFVKNLHTQNYKYWLRSTAEFVQADGSILVPTRAARQAKLETIQSEILTGVEAKSTAWINIGPDRTFKDDGSLNQRPTQVNIFSMAVSPSDNDIMYAAAEGGGIFKSTDHALNWELTSINEVFTNAQDIKVHPVNPNIVYVATESDIYKTINGGLTWSLNFTAPGTVEQFYIHRTTPSKVYAATKNGLFLTEDDGTSWSLILDERCWDIEAHAVNPDILFLSINNNSLRRAEILKSVDAGATWELKDTDWYSPTVFGAATDLGCKIGVTPADPNRIYACLIGDSKSGDNGWIGVYYSEDGADNWVNADGIDGGPYEPGTDMATNWYVAGYADGYHQGWYNFDMDVSDTDPDKIWIGTIWMCESGNRGANIEYIRGTRSLEMHADIQDIDVVNGEVWVASDGGLNFSTDECATVEVRNTGVSSSTFWGFNQGWNEDTWTGGRYHNGDAVYHENFGFGNTMFMGGAETATGYVNPLNNRETHYSDITDRITPDALTEGAPTAQNYSIYPNESYGLLNSSEVEYDHRYADHLFLGNENIFFKSTDGGASFSALFTFPEFARVLEFEVCRENPLVIYCLVREGFTTDIYKSTDGGNNFTILPAIPAADSRLDLTVNPTNPDELWVAATYGADGEKVFATYDGGATWTNRSTPLINGHSIREIVFQAGSDHVVYISSNYAVFYWDQPASQWQVYSDDLPFITRTLHLRPFYRDNKLRLGGGRGIWEVDLAKPSQPVAQPMTKSDVVYCSRDTVQFECYSILAHEGATWEWSFSPAPTYISSTTVRNPKVVFSTNGSYDVTLTVTDGEGNTDTKTVANMVTLDNQCSPDPNPGLAMECYNSGDYASTPDLGIGETNHFTVSAWVKPNGIQPDYTGIVFNDGASAGLNFRPGNQLAYHWPGGAWWWDSGLTVEEGVWSHVALVVTPDSITVYLNGVGSSHVFAVPPAAIETMKLGSYKGWGDRNYKGVMDEVCIWKRDLSQNEIREARHLTRTGEIPYTDDLVSYYQFNIEGITAVNDRIGTHHAVLNSGATKIVSTAPVGGGNSDRIYVTGAGTVDFPNSETQLVFADGTAINGEVVVSRIHLEPDSLPSVNPNVGNYWIVNNYGTETFEAIESVHFKVHDASPEGLPENALLFTRSENEELNTWEERCAAADFDGGMFNYATVCSITNFSQFFIESGINGDDIVTNLNENELANPIRIYPNPSTAVFYIDFDGYEALTLEVIDNAGRLIYTQQINESGKRLDLTHYANGIYIVRLKNEGETVQVSQIVKQ